MKTKTVLAWLNEIECPLTRAAALRQCAEDKQYVPVGTLGAAMSVGLVWENTKEGADFWRDCYDADHGLAPFWPDYPVLDSGAKSNDVAQNERLATDKAGHVTALPVDAAERKKYPMFSGCLNYFPDALALVARCSYDGNQQHHPDKPLHWDKSKSSDELDALVRHMVEGEWEKVCWRALAHCQRMVDSGWKPNA